MVYQKWQLTVPSAQKGIANLKSYLKNMQPETKKNKSTASNY